MATVSASRRVPFDVLSTSTMTGIPRVRLVALMAGIAVCLWAAPGWAEETTQPTFVDPPTIADFLRELERRELDRVAMTWCRERLAAGKLEPEERFAVTLGLARGAARGALADFGPDRETLWNESLQWLETLRAETPVEQRVEVDLEAAELVALRGTWERRWAELRPFDPDAARVARERLRDAVAQSRKLVSQLDQVDPKTGTGKSASQFGAWKDRARLLRVQATLEWIECPSVPGDKVPPEGDTAVLLREVSTALVNLADSLKERRSNTVDRDELFLLEARFARLRQDPVAFQDLLRKGMTGASNTWRQRLEAERIAAGNPVSTGTVTGPILPELEWERLKHSVDRLLSAWRHVASISREDRTAAARELTQQIERFQQSVPASWSLLGQQLGDTLRMQVAYGPVVAPLAEQAQADYLAGRFDAAQQAYRQAAEAAAKQGDGSSAFELGYRGASILVEQKQWEAAAHRLTALVEEQPGLPQAALADLLACHVLGMWAEQSNNAEVRQRWIERLRKHLERFPKSPKRVEVGLELARAHELAGEWSEALKLYQDIPLEHTAAGEALTGMTRAYTALSDANADDADNLARLAEDCRAQWDRRLPAEPRHWHSEACAAAILLARLQLIRRPPLAQEADTWLNAAESRLVELAMADQGDRRVGSLLADARRLRILALAGRGELDAARATLGRLVDTEPSTILSLLDGLDRIAPKEAGTERALAQLQREMAVRLADRRADLTAGQRDRLDRLLARAYLITGDRPAAISRYRALVKSHPRDIPLRIALAEALVVEGGDEPLKEALSLWKGLEGEHKPGTEPWCETRLRQAELLLRTGDRAGAEKLLKLTRLLHPKLGSPEMLRRFGDFEPRLRATPSPPAP